MTSSIKGFFNNYANGDVSTKRVMHTIWIVSLAMAFLLKLTTIPSSMQSILSFVPITTLLICLIAEGREKLFSFDRVFIGVLYVLMAFATSTLLSASIKLLFPSQDSFVRYLVFMAFVICYPLLLWLLLFRKQDKTEQLS